MNCHKCGAKIENNNTFCPECGIKTNTLPRNFNFLYVLLILFSIMILCVGFLLNYYKYNNYKSSIKVKDYIIYFPIGYKTKVEAKNNDENNQCGYVYNTTTSYELCIIDAKYKSYLLSDYKYIKETFNKEGYNIQSINEYNDKLLLIKIDGEKKSNYIYLYNLEDNKIVTGYFAKSIEANDSDIETLNTILSKISK